MMRMEEFAEEILRKVREKAGETLSLGITKVEKNNGTVRMALRAEVPGSTVGPLVYLDDGYGEYREGRIGTGEAAEEIYRAVMRHKDDLRDIDMDGVTQWEKVRSSVRAKLVNAEMNQGLLRETPHRRFLDLAVVYYIWLGETVREEGNITILIRNGHMESLGQDEEGLNRAALANMRLDRPPLLRDIMGLMHSLQPDFAFPSETSGRGPVLYVLTNRSMIFGAAEILDAETMKKIGDCLGNDFAVLPSSVHETLILPLSGREEYSEIADMVRTVNREMVNREERLSDHVYLYERKEGTLRIAA